MGGAISPLGPDSTIESESELVSSRMEARFSALEAKLLKDSEERFANLETSIASLLETQMMQRDKSVIPPRDTTDDVNTRLMLEKLVPIMENNDKLRQDIKDMNDKIELLLGGEKEANKLIDNIVPNIDKVKDTMKTIEKDFRTLKDEAKKIRDDQKLDSKCIRDLVHVVGQCREDQSRLNKRFTEMKRDRSRSESGSRNRHQSSRSSRSRSRSRKRGRGNSSTENNSSLSTRSKTEAEIEKKISKVEENVTTILGSVAELKKDSDSRKGLEEKMLNSLVQVAEIFDTKDKQSTKSIKMKIPPNPSRWEMDDDRSPSPPKRTSRSPVKQSKEKSKKKKRTRSRSSSSSSSSGDESKRNDMEVIVQTVSKIEDRFKKTVTKLKDSNAKVEENSKVTLDRVAEMTAGVQVIAENLDNINDVVRKIDTIEAFRSKFDNLEKLSKLERLDGLWDEMIQLKTMVRQGQISSSVPPRLPPPISLATDDGGWEDTGVRPVQHQPQPPQQNVSEMAEVVKMSLENRFYEFTGIIEDVGDKLSKKIDTLRGDDDVPDLRRRLRRLEDTGAGFSQAPMSPSLGGLTPPPPPMISR